MMKTPNRIRSARNRAADAARYITSMAERALERERYTIEHANDCHCDFCDCFGQGACAGVGAMSPEDYEAYRLSI